MWRNDDLYVALWQMGRPGTEPPDPLAAVRAGKRTGTALPACPLMHGTGLFIALSTLAGGGTVVLIDAMGLDAARVWDEVDRHDVAVLTIVGDAFARPLLTALDQDRTRWSLASLRAITSSGVTWSPEVKRGLLDQLGDVTLLDSLGASEGLMSRSATRAADAQIKPARFAVNDRVRVLTDDGRAVTPGSDEVGMVGVGGRIPLGYYKDPEKTAQTFRTVGGVRYSIPGDYATVHHDGTIRLLGRGSATVNTGGEKVYPEEVELVLRSHPAVDDCVVIGVPDPRFGELVVAVVVTSAPVAEAELRDHCRDEGLSGYKIPKRVVPVADMRRAPNGKADYTVLRSLATAELGITA
jgi:fatty-acyl-CoA synthase